jgi:hypothetical protein
MSCQCHQIGGPFIAEDPDCPAHGREAQRADEHRQEIIRQLSESINTGTSHDIYDAALHALEYLQSL